MHLQVLKRLRPVVWYLVFVFTFTSIPNSHILISGISLSIVSDAWAANDDNFTGTVTEKIPIALPADWDFDYPIQLQCAPAKRLCS
ncbi:MAG: hypothetical protein CSYNP_04078 [Syntrophus sp. SKADARSKE-3]|nr:hypothetical protein [Syntrophus sp. SKADARSKE-3]